MRYFLLTFILVLLTSCSSPAATAISAQTPAQTSSPPPTVTSTKTAPATKTPAPTATSIPGFEDWSVFNPGLVDIKTENSSLILTLKHRALWFMDQRGVLVYKEVTGNFKITANVHTAKKSDPTKPPGGDGSVQLGGVMARNGDGGRENYVFIVVGDDSDGLSVETKNTTDGNSKYEGPAWDSKDAELRICRIGQTFNFYKRHVNANEPWTLAA